MLTEVVCLGNQRNSLILVFSPNMGPKVFKIGLINVIKDMLYVGGRSLGVHHNSCLYLYCCLQKSDKVSNDSDCTDCKYLDIYNLLEGRFNIFFWVQVVLCVFRDSCMPICSIVMEIPIKNKAC